MSESRRYFVANRLRYMWVLTFTGAGLHGPDGRAECMKAVANFVRRFHREFGAMPYWASPELHPGGHGWHVNFFIPKRLKHEDMEGSWSGREIGLGEVETGTVWVSDKLKDPRVKRSGLPFVEALRLGARYACKYAAKDWNPIDVPPGAHRFVAAAGFKPAKESIGAWSLREGILKCVERFDRPPSTTWRSADCDDWDGPSVVVLRWTARAGETPDG